jgi:rod shape-determining protein MreC
LTLPTRTRRALACVALFLLPVYWLSHSLRRPGELNQLDRLLLRISAPLQDLLTRPVRGLSALTRDYAVLVGVRRENTRLRAENTRLTVAAAQSELLAARLERAERLLDLREQLRWRSLAARVVATDTSPFFRVTRVRLEVAAAGLRDGLPVVAPEGLVGRLRQVSGRYAEVLLLADPESSLDVVVARTGSRGVLRGVLADDHYRCRVEYLLRSDEVKDGDLVVSSGMGGAVPGGIPVGTLTRVRRQESGLHQQAEVTPAVDLSRLEQVLVLLAPAESMPPRAAQRVGERPASEAGQRAGR